MSNEGGLIDDDQVLVGLLGTDAQLSTEDDQA